MFIPVDDAQIYALSFGPPTGPAILALGGWIGSWEDWADCLAALSQNWRALAFDHRGSGVTLAPVDSITWPRLVQDVMAVLDALQVETCVLAAMSAGAAVALRAAQLAPHRIRGLVIVNGLDLRSGPQPDGPFLAALQRDYAGALDFFVEACVPEKDSQPIKQWGRKILERAAPEAALALWRLTQTVDLRQDIPHIRQPTLVLHGDADTLVPLEAARWLADTLPAAQLVTLPGAGHVPTMTRPLAVAAAIDAFFRG